MKIVSQRTGLSPHVVRAWEKRYSAVEPDRSGTNRRLYSEADIERLSLLHDLTKAGHSIGQIAKLSTSQLQHLVVQTKGRENGHLHLLNDSSPDEPPAKRSERVSEDRVQEFLQSALEACRNMDQGKLEEVLDSAIVGLGYSGLVERLAGPLITSIGEEWHDGIMTAAQEHAATATIRSHIEKHVRLFPISEGAPTIVVTTPAGQIHELGAILATAVARKVGWNVVYLGSSLPAAEIASALQQCRAKALALSISYPADDPSLPEELATLRNLAGDDLMIFAGGRCASAYQAALEKSSIRKIDDLGDLRSLLLKMRSGLLPSAVES